MPNMVMAMAGLVGFALGFQSQYHAGDGVGRVAQDGPADDVEAQHVGHRVHHADVLGAHVGPELEQPAGDGGQHQLGHADGQGAHGGSADGRPLPAAQADDALQPPLVVEVQDDAAQALGLRGDGMALFAPLQQGLQGRACCLSHVVAADVGLDRRLRRARRGRSGSCPAPRPPRGPGRRPPLRPLVSRVATMTTVCGVFAHGTLPRSSRHWCEYLVPSIGHLY